MEDLLFLPSCLAGGPDFAEQGVIGFGFEEVVDAVALAHLLLDEAVEAGREVAVVEHGAVAGHAGLVDEALGALVEDGLEGGPFAGLELFVGVGDLFEGALEGLVFDVEIH